MGDLLTLALMAAWLMLPAYAANIAPVLAARWKIGEPLAFPVDLGAKLGGKPVLGPHKTFRGFAVGIIAAFLVVLLQARLQGVPFFDGISLFYYPGENPGVLALALGGGALVGDAVKSFFKRRAGVPSGKDWPFFDQVDFVLGALFFLSFVTRPPFGIVIMALAVSPLLHLLVDAIGRKTGIKRVA